jgi:hypothetical protein
MATIQNLLRCHAIEFGYLFDPASGQLLRGYGRHLVRSTRGYPEGCLPVATPSRIASHVSALPHTVDPDHDDPGALLISPSYERNGAGTLRGAWTTIQRVRLSPHEDDDKMPGDAVRSSALILSWNDFGRAASGLGAALAGLRAERVSIGEPRETRLERPRLPLDVSEPDGSTTPQMESASNAILGTVLRGARLRLDARWCADEMDFIAAYIDALGRLPAPMRAHVSVAAGVCQADRGFQIVWCRDISGLDPAEEAAASLIGLGAQWQSDEAGLDGDCIVDDPRFAGQDGLVSATFKTPEFHAHVRRELAKRCRSPAEIGGGGAPTIERLLLRAAKGECLAPVQAAQLLRDFARLGADRKALRPAARTSFRLLGGLASTDCSLEEIATAVEVCDAADEPFESQHILRIRRLAGELLASRLSASACPSPELLNALAGRPGLARTAAQEIGNGNERVIVPVRRILAAIARRDGPEAPSLRRLAGPLLPRDHRVVTVWRGYRHDDVCLAQALIDVASGSRAIDDDSAGIIAGVLIDGGKWNLVRDALAQLVSRLGRADRGVLNNLDSQINQLRLISVLGSAMERACEPSASEPSRRVG